MAEIIELGSDLDSIPGLMPIPGAAALLAMEEDALAPAPGTAKSKTWLWLLAIAILYMVLAPESEDSP